jgi:hypothetical protein
VSILDRKQTIRLRQKLAAHGVTIKKGLRISQQASWRQVMAQGLPRWTDSLCSKMGRRQGTSAYLNRYVTDGVARSQGKVEN